MLFPHRAAQLCGLFALLSALSAAPTQASLDYQQAVQIALELDPESAAQRLEAEALQAGAVADSQWADPMVKFGVANLPTDSFAFDEQPMTQKVVGISQQLPRGDSARLSGERGLLQAEASFANAADRELQLALAVSDSFLQLSAQLERRRLLQENRLWLEQLVEYDRNRLATGEVQSQRMLQTQLALARLDDRLQSIGGDIDRARGELTRWIGEAAWQPVNTRLPDWPDTEAWLQARQLPVPPESIAGHPALEAAGAMVEAQSRNVALAHEAYKPQWKLELSYGQRQPTPMSDGADFASALVSVDLPLFRHNRQDQRLAAARARESAGILQRQNLLQRLHGGLNSAAASAESLQSRRHLYRNQLLPTAEATADALLQGYAANTADLDAVISARMEAIEAQIAALQLDYDYFRALARIRYYLAGAVPADSK
ncbi:TolC family protein [Microbulbifer guangxiensis]|uniref:TolC family protein n=1 Tax=Microbulbifer guangxiensis TaxID=2904249 RepID=UPI001F00F845|nr:TolC family protein [Microbulbifer guangxiensis]